MYVYILYYIYIYIYIYIYNNNNIYIYIYILFIAYSSSKAPLITIIKVIVAYAGVLLLGLALGVAHQFRQMIHQLRRNHVLDE